MNADKECLFLLVEIRDLRRSEIAQVPFIFMSVYFTHAQSRFF